MHERMGGKRRYRGKLPSPWQRPHVRLCELAYDDAKIIRQLWREHYRTDRRKPHDAFWFAAQIWGVKVNQLREFKPSGKRRTG